MAYDENGYWISDDEEGSDWATGNPTTGGYPGTTGWTPGGDLPGGGDELPPWAGGPPLYTGGDRDGGDPGGGTGGNWWDRFMPGGGGGGSGGGMDPVALAMLGPALTTAYKQWTDAGKYRDSADRAVKASDPYRDRDMYADRLKRMTEDPNAYLKDSPDYQAALKQGIGGVERSQAAQGYLGSGNMLTALNDYSAETAAKYLDRDRQSLMQMAKGNPNAGDYIMRGDENAIKSQNAALGSLFSPFGAMMGAKGGRDGRDGRDGRNGSGSGGGGPNGGGPGGGFNAAQTAMNQAIKAGNWAEVSRISRMMGQGNFNDYFRTEDPNGPLMDDHYDLPGNYPGSGFEGDEESPLGYYPSDPLGGGDYGPGGNWELPEGWELGTFWD